MFTLCYVLHLHDHLLFFHSVDLDILLAQKIIIHSFVLISLLYRHANQSPTLQIRTNNIVSHCYEEDLIYLIVVVKQFKIDGIKKITYEFEDLNKKSGIEGKVLVYTL